MSDLIERLGVNQPITGNLQALAQQPESAISVYGAEWAGRCAASALDEIERLTAEVERLRAELQTALGKVWMLESQIADMQPAPTGPLASATGWDDVVGRRMREHIDKAIKEAGNG